MWWFKMPYEAELDEMIDEKLLQISDISEN